MRQLLPIAHQNDFSLRGGLQLSIIQQQSELDERELGARFLTSLKNLMRPHRRHTARQLNVHSCLVRHHMTVVVGMVVVLGVR